MRRTILIALVLVVCAAVGAGAGYLYAWWTLGPTVQSPVQATQAGERATEPLSTVGWCCYKGDPACKKVNKPVDCFEVGGMSYNGIEKNCNEYCSWANR